MIFVPAAVLVFLPTAARTVVIPAVARREAGRLRRRSLLHQLLHIGNVLRLVGLYPDNDLPSLIVAQGEDILCSGLTSYADYRRSFLAAKLRHCEVIRLQCGELWSALVAADIWADHATFDGLRTSMPGVGSKSWALKV